ncbi:metallopeptidase TldD-related protein [Actinoallomurus acaciae]|uniref:Metallopeptidase TldD-related protein n=1 Tax=Actinoallomurus acaciae TaxID=502577 RepID=A0ABV5Y8S1_9ACTN
MTTHAGNRAVDSAQELAEAALAESAADGCVVVVEEHSETNLRWAANALTTNGQARTRSLTVISTFERADGASAGVVTRAVTTAREVADLVHASEAAGRTARPTSEASPLVEPYEHDDDWAAAAAETSAAVFEDLVPALGAAFGRWRREGRLLFGYAEHQMSSCFLATSTGLRRRFDQPDGRLELTGKSGDLTRATWSGAHVPDFAGVDVTTVAEALGQRLDQSPERVALPAGRYETILPPAAVADLMICAYQKASARDADEGRNVYGAGGGSRIGERLSTLPLTLRSDPAEPGLRCSPFAIITAPESGMESVFDNGQPVSAVPWISRGHLTDLVRTRSWARHTGSRPRPRVGNLILDGGGDATLEQMIATTERGLLLTSLWYVREVDPRTLLSTGLTRDGVYLVENGRIRGTVNNFRFNESPTDLLGRLTEAGRSEHTLPRERSDRFRRTKMPAIRVPDFNMSTVSDAV